MSTFREIARKVIEEGVADLQSQDEIWDRHGVLAGAMVDAATIAVQDWLAAQGPVYRLTRAQSPARLLEELIREAGKVAQ